MIPIHIFEDLRLHKFLGCWVYKNGNKKHVIKNKKAYLL